MLAETGILDAEPPGRPIAARSQAIDREIDPAA
jgi:hypothetical protein